MKIRILISVAALTATFLFIAFGTATVYAKGDPEELEYPTYGPTTIITPFVEDTLWDERPFTPAGTGTVINNATDEDGKEFFTITSANGNIFYLVIDRQRGQENVYFLNAVTERDLLALAEQSGDSWEPEVEPPPIIPTSTSEPEYEPEPLIEPEELEQGGGTGLITLLITLILGGIGAGWYFKVYRPKQQKIEMMDDYENNYSDEANHYNENTEYDTPSWDTQDEKDKQ